jgi:hypothetical protein
MSTRVSWIDETHLQALLQRLDAPVPAEAQVEAPELETLPDADDAPLPFFEEEVPLKPEPAPVADEFPELPAPPAEPEQAEPAVEESHEEPAPAAEAEAAPPLDRIRERLKMIRHRAAAAGILSHSLPLSEMAPVSVQSPEARLASFAKQVLSSLPEGSKLLILDADGAILWNNDPKPGLILSTLMALKAARQSSVDVIQQAREVVHHMLSADEVLSVSTHITTTGPLQIAIRAPEAIGADLIAPHRPLL